MQVQKQLKQGADPRGFADYVALKAELDKLYHPARPEVDWLYAEQLCISLFKQNGVELCSAAWFCFIRTRINGLPGMNEGLALVHALVTGQWTAFWPSQLHARLELLSELSQRLLQSLRGMQWSSSDLPDLYKSGRLLGELCSRLEMLEIKHHSELERLESFVNNAVKQLEREEGGAARDMVVSREQVFEGGMTEKKDAKSPLVYVITAGQEKNTAKCKVVKKSKGFKLFLSGVAAGAGLVAVISWCLNAYYETTVENIMAESFMSLPSVLSDSQQAKLGAIQLQHNKEWILGNTKRQIEMLGQHEPTWQYDFEQQLLQQLISLLPESQEAVTMQDNWYHKLELGALSMVELSAWSNGMDELAKLSAKLDALDEKRGQYMTISQLKSEVFNIRQAFQGGVPLEERLRQVASGQQHKTALKMQFRNHMQQLLYRYLLINERDEQSASLTGVMSSD